MTLEPSNINKTQTKKRVLIAPLDWGLGHATRCVPLIREFLAQGFEVLLAAENAGAALLQEEFPALPLVPLRGYRVTYSKKSYLFFFTMLLQARKIVSAIRSETHALRKIIREHKIDIVVSDNRFGFYNKKIHSVFITHQLFINTGNRVTDYIAQLINYRFINRFDECWIPDHEGPENLAGKLSHPEKMPNTAVKYIGPLSRFTKGQGDKIYDGVAVVSGPEPQRTIFENMLLSQITSSQKIVLVRGLPGNKENTNAPDNVFNHLPSRDLNDLLLSAKIVIARSGYSTVMDLAAIGQKAILIATPGQREQEYLAAYLSEKKYCSAANDKDFNLSDELEIISKKNLISFPEAEPELLKRAVSAVR